MGSLDYPFNPLSLVIGAEATFVARAIDTDRKHLTTVLRRAAEHKGTAFVEILQNCNIYNDGAFDFVREEEENRLYLEDGQPVGETGLIHDERAEDPAQAFALTRITWETHGKVPLGVFRDVQRPVYDELMAEQLAAAVEKRGVGDLGELLNAGDTWEIG
jgi:2-oxoglutarate ferredoxin oxidoreductase subunit beta